MALRRISHVEHVDAISHSRQPTDAGESDSGKREKEKNKKRQEKTKHKIKNKIKKGQARSKQSPDYYDE